MKRTATITSKGQLTIPAEIRRQLGLREGDQVEFVSDDGRMWLRPVTQGDNPFLAYAGARPQGLRTLHDARDWTRDLRDDTDER